MPRLSAVGISGLQAGEDVKNLLNGSPIAKQVILRGADAVKKILLVHG